MWSAEQQINRNSWVFLLHLHNLLKLTNSLGQCMPPQSIRSKIFLPWTLAETRVQKGLEDYMVYDRGSFSETCITYIMCVLYGLVLVWIALHVEGVPCPDNCVCASNLKVTCNLEKHEDYAALLTLDTRTEALTCSVAKRFNETAANFGHFYDLRTLILKSSKRYSNIQAAQRDGAISHFQHRKLFQNLTGLSYLGINVVTSGFDPALLENIPNINALDLSYSLMKPNTSKQILMWVNQNNFTIHTLLMISTQHRDLRYMPQAIYTRDDIYKNVNKLPLRILDLSENVAVVIQEGLSPYLPRLEIFRVGASFLLTCESYSHLKRLLFDVIMHLSIKEYTLRFPSSQCKISFRSTRESGIFYRLPLPLGHVAAEKIRGHNHTNTSREITNASFRQLLARMNKLAGHAMYTAEPACVLGVRIPLPRHLERLTFIDDHNFIGYSSLHLYRNKSFCFEPDNNLRYFDSSRCDVHTNPDIFGIRGMKKLVYFNVQQAQVTFKTTMSIFSDMESLEILLLGGNNISLDKPEDLDFLHINTLRVLDIQECGIKHMPHHTLMGLKSLAFLNVSRNSLEEFNVNITGLKDLKFLNLSGNSLRSLSKTVILALETAALRQNFTVDLSRNPLDCSCSNLHFVRWLQTSRAKFATKELTLCSNPWGSPRSPWAVDEEQLYRVCIHFQTIISSVVSGLGMSLVIGVTYVMYRRRWTIRYWMHIAREWMRKKRTEERSPLLKNRYTYDAFVAYSSRGEERKWVHITLREKLETEHNLKLCMYHRDFKVARDLADTIVEGINSSRNTLLILSPTFLESCWCDFEVRMANEKAIKERRDSLIIVLFSKLHKPHTRLPKTLTRLLERKIYLEWTEDPDGQRLFWRRLVEAIEKDSSYDSFADAANAQN